jgi:hypothetical protein
VRFVVVYIREAHPTDGWQVKQNEDEKILIKDPKTDAERIEVAKDFAKQFKVTIPVVIDTIDDKTEKAYAGWPDRMFLIGADGKLKYKGAPGPRGFKVDEVRAAIKELPKK